MARRYCFAPGCHSGYSGNTEKVSLFKVPKDKLKEWSEVIPRADRQLTINDALCEKHFFKEDVLHEVVTDTYSYPLKKPRLRENARPTIWPNCPNYLSKQSVKKRRLIERHEYLSKRKKKHNTMDADKVFDEHVATTSQEYGENISVNTKSDEMIGAEDSSSFLHKLFDMLCKNKITLPSESWTIKFHNKIIAVFKTAEIEDDIVITQKIVLSKSSFNFYIFQRLQNHLTEDSVNKIHSVADFQKFLIDLDQISICFGVNVREGYIDFSKTRYRRDEFSKTVRHENCKYILCTKERLRTNINYCSLCQNAKKSIRYLKIAA